MDEVADQAALNAFLRKTVREQKEQELISDGELTELGTSLEWRHDDRERARAYLLRKIEQEQQFELDRFRAEETAKIRRIDLDAAIEEDRKRFESDMGKRRTLAEVEAYEAGKRHGVEVDRVDLGEKQKDADHRRKMEELERRGAVLGGIKRGKAEADVLRLGAARGLSAEQITAVMAGEHPHLAEALKEAMSKLSAEKLAQVNREHADEIRQLYEAAQGRDSGLLRELVGKLSDVMGAALTTRAAAGDRVGEAVKEVVKSTAPRAVRHRCRVCHGEWEGDDPRCPTGCANT
jgi:hypothetical protein